MKLRNLFTSPRSAFRYRDTRPTLAFLQTIVLFLFMLIFPSYTLATYPDYVESEVDLIRYYMFYDSEPTTCKIASYILTCDEVEEGINTDGSTTVVANSDEVMYVISVEPKYDTYVYVFTENKMEYLIAGVVITSNTYEELGVSDLDFESLRHSYSPSTYEGITTLISNQYELNKSLITTITVTLFVATNVIAFMIMLLLVTVLLIFSNKGQVRTGQGLRLRKKQLFTMACYSTYIPVLAITLAYLYSGSLMIDVLFFSSAIMSIIASNVNRKKNDNSL